VHASQLTLREWWCIMITF